MPTLAYSAILLIPLLAGLSLAAGGMWTFGVPLLVFGLLPVIEAFLPGSYRNPSPEEEQARRAALWRYDAVIFAALTLHLAVLAAFIFGVSQERWHGAALFGATATVGLSCGAIGINLGHELGHRQRRLHQAAARVALLSSLYLHFVVEHNRGHHIRVATPEDPATARRGETVYAFWARSIAGGWRSAWAIEARRLHGSGVSPLSPRNEVLTGASVQLGLLVVVALTLGPAAALAWLAVGLGGILLLETVNYVEHYGLLRELRPDGRYARVAPLHSWTSDRAIGRVLLFELTRHADHHANAGRPYPVLRHFSAAPELPQGYPAMIVLALLPPLWFRVMDAHVDDELRRLAALAPAAPAMVG